MIQSLERDFLFAWMRALKDFSPQGIITAAFLKEKIRFIAVYHLIIRSKLMADILSKENTLIGEGSIKSTNAYKSSNTATVT